MPIEVDQLWWVAVGKLSVDEHLGIVSRIQWGVVMKMATSAIQEWIAHEMAELRAPSLDRSR